VILLVDVKILRTHWGGIVIDAVQISSPCKKGEKFWFLGDGKTLASEQASTVKKSLADSEISYFAPPSVKKRNEEK
jgi:hypothetical protein